MIRRCALRFGKQFAITAASSANRSGLASRHGIVVKRSFGWFSGSSQQPEGESSKNDYTIDNFKQDFPELSNMLKQILADNTNNKHLDQSAVLTLMTAAMTLNYQRLLQFEKSMRSQRRELIKTGKLEEFEKLVTENETLCEKMMQKDLEHFSEHHGIEPNHLKISIQHLSKSDPAFPRRIEECWNQAHSMPKETQKYNPRGLTDDELVEAFKFMSKEASNYNYEAKDSQFSSMVKSLYLSDRLAMEKGVEPEDLVLQPEKMSHRVAMALTAYKQKMYSKVITIR